jgi:ketopantoate hydroxymethyltransferase
MRRLITNYIDDVRNGTFPGEEHVCRMIDGEAAKLEADETD